MSEQVTLSKEYHLPILQFLYQYKDNAGFQVLDNNLLNTKPQKEKYKLLNQLKEYGLINFEKELKYEEPAMGTFNVDTSTIEMAENPVNNEPIKAKITDKGIGAVDKYNAT